MHRPPPLIAVRLKRRQERDAIRAHGATFVQAPEEPFSLHFALVTPDARHPVPVETGQLHAEWNDCGRISSMKHIVL
jgi:hypothetical protein